MSQNCILSWCLILKWAHDESSVTVISPCLVSAHRPPLIPHIKRKTRNSIKQMCCSHGFFHFFQSHTVNRLISEVVGRIREFGQTGGCGPAGRGLWGCAVALSEVDSTHTSMLRMIDTCMLGLLETEPTLLGGGGWGRGHGQGAVCHDAQAWSKAHWPRRRQRSCH